MKSLQLKDVMQNLKVTLTDTGYELSNEAGTAQHDAWGVRTTVNGVPEYFPITLSVKDKRESKTESAFTVKNGQVFIDNANICGEVYTSKISGSIFSARDPLAELCGEAEDKAVSTLSVKIEVDTAEAEKKLEGFAIKAKGLAAFADVTTQTQMIREVIMKELNPGGLLYRW